MTGPTALFASRTWTTTGTSTSSCTSTPQALVENGDLDENATELILHGQTLGGQAIQGSDSRQYRSIGQLARGSVFGCLGEVSQLFSFGFLLHQGPQVCLKRKRSSKSSKRKCSTRSTLSSSSGSLAPFRPSQSSGQG